MTTIPGGDEPREDQTKPDEPTPAIPAPPESVAPEPPEPVIPAPDAGMYPPPGSYPPGASSYPPPGYGYQQAPPPGYGYQQAPPPYQQPPAGYAPGVPQPSLFSVALSDGWRAFTRAGWVFVGAAVVWFLIGLAVLGILGTIFGGWSRITSANGSGLRAFTGASFSVSSFVLGIIAAIIAGLIQAQFVRVALAVTRGHRPVFAEFFRFENAGPVAVLVLIIGVVEGVVRVIPFVGGLIGIVVQFFLIFAYFVLMDRTAQPVDAIRGSVEMVTRNAGQTLVFYILSVLITAIGALLCGIGLLVAVPWVLLATAYLYRRLTGEQPQLPA